MTEPLPDLASAIRWFHPLWTERLASVPVRLHVHDVEPDSRLGSPKLSRAFLGHIASAAHDVAVVTETRDCHHHRNDGRSDWECPDCAGSGTYEARRLYYRDPVASAIDSLRRRPGSWPRGFIPPDRLILEFVVRGYDLGGLALELVVREKVLAGYLVLAFSRLRGRYRAAPPTRIGWVDKSESQQAAETAA